MTLSATRNPAERYDQGGGVYSFPIGPIVFSDIFNLVERAKCLLTFCKDLFGLVCIKLTCVITWWTLLELDVGSTKFCFTFAKLMLKFVALSVAVATTVYLTKRYFGGRHYVYSRGSSLEGKVVIVTGANSGIGKEVALELVQQGASVILACRSEVDAQITRQYIIQKSGRSTVTSCHLDLNSFHSIRQFSQSFQESGNELFALVNNAGVFYHPPLMTEDGYDVTFQTNYLGPFLLTHLLLDTLTRSAPSRIINVSSEAHRGVKHFDISKILSDWNSYDRFQAYGQSKFCLMLFTHKLAQHLKPFGITVNAVNPGNVETNVYRHFPFLTNPLLAAIQWPIRFIVVKTPWEGAQSVLHSILEPSLEGQSGKYISNCQESAPSALSLDDSLAEELYTASLKWCNISTAV